MPVVKVSKWYKLYSRTPDATYKKIQKTMTTSGAIATIYDNGKVLSNKQDFVYVNITGQPFVVDGIDMVLGFQVANGYVDRLMRKPTVKGMKKIGVWNNGKT